MKLARYVGDGRIEIREEAPPSCPEGGLLVRTLASGLCSGELMQWYMDQKIPHVLGHEVCGRVLESQDPRYPAGCLVAPHHHAPCLQCAFCQDKLYVHCAQWRSTKLNPGGMAEVFAVPMGNLNDTLRVDGMRPIDAALIEPLACVAKSIRQAALHRYREPRIAVIGLGVMGLLHLLALPQAVGFEVNSHRLQYAQSLGLNAQTYGDTEPFDVAFVCAANSRAMESVMTLMRPGGTVAMFSPMDPQDAYALDLRQFYFKDLTLANSYSCGPNDTLEAKALLESGQIRAEQVVSDFVALDALPDAYEKMKGFEILKAMVLFD